MVPFCSSSKLMLAATLAMVEVVFNPSWTAVEKARKGLNVSCIVIGVHMSSLALASLFVQ